MWETNIYIVSNVKDISTKSQNEIPLKKILRLMMLCICIAQYPLTEHTNSFLQPFPYACSWNVRDVYGIDMSGWWEQKGQSFFTQ